MRRSKNPSPKHTKKPPKSADRKSPAANEHEPKSNIRSGTNVQGSRSPEWSAVNYHDPQPSVWSGTNVQGSRSPEQRAVHCHREDSECVCGGRDALLCTNFHFSPTQVLAFAVSLSDEEAPELIPPFSRAQRIEQPLSPTQKMVIWYRLSTDHQDKTEVLPVQSAAEKPPEEEEATPRVKEDEGLVPAQEEEVYQHYKDEVCTELVPVESPHPPDRAAEKVKAQNVKRKKLEDEVQTLLNQQTDRNRCRHRKLHDKIELQSPQTKNHSHTANKSLRSRSKSRDVVMVTVLTKAQKGSRKDKPPIPQLTQQPTPHEPSQQASHHGSADIRLGHSKSSSSSSSRLKDSQHSGVSGTAADSGGPVAETASGKVVTGRSRQKYVGGFKARGERIRTEVLVSGRGGEQFITEMDETQISSQKLTREEFRAAVKEQRRLSKERKLKKQQKKEFDANSQNETVDVIISPPS